MLGVFLAFGINQGMALALSTDMPIVAVESNSMCAENSCTFAKGDLLILQGTLAENLGVGDIIVYSVPGQSVPIVHRIIEINADGSFQTMGDANNAQLPFEKHIQASQIHGKEIAIIPVIGWVKIGLTEFVLPNTLWIAVILVGVYAIIRFKPLERLGTAGHTRSVR
jgi:signal peptidase